MRYYKIYVDNTQSLYTYSDENEEYEIGDRVIVSFRNRDKSGLIIDEDKAENITFKVLPIKSRLENEIKLSENFIKLLRWIKTYYMSSYEQVINAAVPSDLKVKYDSIYVLEDIRNIFQDGAEDIYSKELIKIFKERITITKATLNKKFTKEVINEMIGDTVLFNEKGSVKLNYNFDFSILKKNFEEVVIYFRGKEEVQKKSLEVKLPKELINKLIKEKLLILKKNIKEDESQRELQEISNEVSEKNVVLNEEQERAKNIIKDGDNKYYLLKGITGSGKTEVYIELIKEAFKKGKGSIFLVPEISLTPQMINRFKNEFRENIAILHSKLTNKERADEWYNIYTGNKKIVLGVRSAIFAPVENLEYIILDEEHENTYKQDSNPRYNAKYVAIKKAELEGAKLILGSATPSIESSYYAEKGIYTLVTMDSRYNNSVLPEIEIIDMKKEEDLYFSKKLLEEMKTTLLKGEQIILLLNRKGYSTYIQCKDCGHVEECSHCSIKSSYYASQGILKCNYCGQTRRYTGHCSECGSTNLIHSGKGVERVEEEAKKYFDVRVIRVDSESSKNKDFYEKMYFDFLGGKYDIMIGTQMISKGLHFPNVTLVGVINADTILNFPDFRAGEKTFQLVTQVSGRAGRGDKKGKVIVQTYQPENYTFKMVEKTDYNGFYSEEISNRELLEYPPFSKTINIGISSKKEKELEIFVKEFFLGIEDENIEMYGPMKSLVYRVKDRFRYNIFIKGSKKNISLFKRKLSKKLIDYKKSNDFRIVVDVDPINLI